MAHRNPFARNRAAAGDEVPRSSGVLLAIIALAVAGAIAALLLFPDHRRPDHRGTEPADAALRATVALGDGAAGMGDEAARTARNGAQAR
jgi:hypothetical protein